MTNVLIEKRPGEHGVGAGVVGVVGVGGIQTQPKNVGLDAPGLAFVEPETGPETDAGQESAIDVAVVRATVPGLPRKATGNVAGPVVTSGGLVVLDPPQEVLAPNPESAGKAARLLQVAGGALAGVRG